MQTSKTFGAIMLVSSTTIGGGILALPLHTFNAGIIPTAANLLVSWLFMTLAALYLLEVSLKAKPGANLISMANDTLGNYGKSFAWFTYLALLYALMCAFISSLGTWLSALTNIPSYSASILTSLLFSVIFYAGNSSLDLINKIFSSALFISLLYIISQALIYVDLSFIVQHNVLASVRTTPLILTSFGFAIVIPSINNYLNFAVKKIKAVILIGSVIPLVIYLLWEFSLLGALQQPLASLQGTAAHGTEVATALSSTLQNDSVTFFADLFSLTAIITSVLGVGLSLFDFLADGFKINKTPRGKIQLCLLIFLPTILFINFLLLGFDVILSFGGIFVACLLGILPTLMVWRQRQVPGNNSQYRAPGDKALMVLSILFFLSVIAIECYNCLS